MSADPTQDQSKGGHGSNIPTGREPVQAVSALFRCHPLVRVGTWEIPTLWQTTPLTLYNPSVVDAFPTITFDGTFVINGDTFVAATELTVDAEAMVVTKESGGETVSATADLTGSGGLKLVPRRTTPSWERYYHNWWLIKYMPPRLFRTTGQSARLSVRDNGEYALSSRRTYRVPTFCAEEETPFRQTPYGTSVATHLLTH